MSTWAHHATPTYCKGKVRLICACGKWRSRAVPTEQLAELYKEHIPHTGLIEKEGRK